MSTYTKLYTIDYSDGGDTVYEGIDKCDDNVDQVISNLNDCHMSTAGDMIYFSTGAVHAISVGAQGSILKSNGTLPTWAARGATGGLLYSTDSDIEWLGTPAQGDILVANSTTHPSWLNVGVTGALLYSDNTDPTWMTVAASQGNLLTFNSTSEPEWLAVGAADSILKSDGTDPGWLAAGATGAVLYQSTTGLAWKAVGGDGALLRVTTDNPNWLALGTVGKYLRVNAGAGDVEWSYDLTVTTITSTTTLTDAHQVVLCDVSGGSGFDVDLPTAVGRAGKMFIIKDTGSAAAGTGATIDPSGSQEIDGNASPPALTSAYTGMAIVSDGANWMKLYDIP